jgi:N6-L-threonylcarbamoyladenine synthase
MTKRNTPVILGIESSCDETAAALVTANREVLSNVVYSQIHEHEKFGGVVPEIAARAHLEKIDCVVDSALSEAKIDISEIDAVAGTCGPGLIGGIIVGATFAKSISLAMNIPFIAINHLEAHAISVRLTENIEFPYLLILASGGHCQICVVHSIDEFEVVGKTLDDSIGESFDKVSRMMGLGYPGGHIIEDMAKKGNDQKFRLPHPLCNKNSCDFSFSGLKTAVRIILEQELSEQEKRDLCASFQRTVAEILVYKMNVALELCRNNNTKLTAVIISGGVAANQTIGKILRETCRNHNIYFSAPPIPYCTDNGAMIAWLGMEKYMKQQFDELNFSPKPRWPLSVHL